METGHCKPGRELLLRVTEQLGLPFRERNKLLLVAGHAPAFPEHELRDRRAACDAGSRSPAVVVDRGWNVVAAIQAIQALAQRIDSDLREPPLNAMRAGLHPRGWLAGSSTSAIVAHGRQLGTLAKREYADRIETWKRWNDLLVRAQGQPRKA